MPNRTPLTMTTLDRDAHKYAPMGDADDTFARINALANERQRLWLLGGVRPMEELERSRCEAITRALPELWDELRRQLAVEHTPPEMQRSKHEDGRSKRVDLAV